MHLKEDIEEIDVSAAMHLRPRQLSLEQTNKFEAYVAEILTALGMDLDTPATVDTPRRYVRALIDATDGYEGDPKLLRVFETECRGGPDCRTSQVIEGPVHFFSLCEHHALPFFGHAYVGYIAHEHIIGLSKLTRLVRLFAKRFAVQERIGEEIADTLGSGAAAMTSTRPSGRSFWRHAGKNANRVDVARAAIRRRRRRAVAIAA